MCGRYAFIPDKNFYREFEIVNSELILKDNYNVLPGNLEPVIVRNSPNSVELMKWGLIPPWAKDIRIGYKMINCRAETITDKVSFKRSFKNKRCIVPASGFYEWQKTDKGKIAYYIKVKDKNMFGIAGLYEIAKDAEGKEIKSFTIITTTVNKFMAGIHDRMPVIIHPEDYSLWLDNQSYDEQKLMKILCPYDGDMEKSLGGPD